MQTFPAHTVQKKEYSTKNTFFMIDFSTLNELFNCVHYRTFIELISKIPFP
jgi:hypothetical protein